MYISLRRAREHDVFSFASVVLPLNKSSAKMRPTDGSSADFDRHRPSFLAREIEVIFLYGVYSGETAVPI